MLIFALLLAASAHADSSSALYKFDGHGFVATQSCSLSASNVADVPVSLRDLNASVQMSRFAPLEGNDGAPISLDNSTWKLAVNGNAPVKANCADSKESYFVVQSVRSDSSSSLMLIAPSQVSALTNLLAEFTQVPKATSQLNLKTMAVQVVEGSVDDVICTSSSSLNVRESTLKNVIFAANRLESVKRTQSFSTTEKTAVISGKTYTFIEVQFPTRSNVNGWVAKDFVKNRTECGVVTPAPLPVNTNAYVFPTIARPSVSYLTGQRAFGSSRGGGSRAHAANDLYRVKGEKVVAVAAGTVIRDIYSFYEGTYALEVKQADGRVVRYGEITGTRAPNIKSGSAITPGQVIGYVGKVNSGCCTPMLHFELYSGKSTGALTRSGNKYVRRSDLVNPTQDLRGWEMKTFGKSY